MRYLKKFNESKNIPTKEELVDFCKDSLSFLLDDGYKLITRLESYDTYVIIIRKQLDKDQNDRPITNFFKWDDVSDYYLPFLDRFTQEYEIVSDIKIICTSPGNLVNFTFKVSDILNETDYFINGISKENIHSISFEVKGLSQYTPNGMITRATRI